MKAEAKNMPKSKGAIPEKPKTESGFEKPVAWLLGRQLIANLKGSVAKYNSGRETA